MQSANEEAANLGKVFEEMDANGNQKVTVKEVRCLFVCLFHGV